MTKLNVPYIPKKGGLGVLALSGILIIALIFAFYFWPTDEIVAKPTVEQTVNEAVTQLADNKAETAPKVTSVVSLDDAKPKIDPELIKELKELKRQKKHRRVTVLVELKDEQALEAVKQAGGTIQQNFDIGNIAVVEVQSDRVEEVASAAGVEQVAAEKEYVALLADRIPAFSIDTAAWASNITGKGVKIAILDTGVGPNDKITVAEGASFVEGEDAADQNGHGTHVAGIAQGVAKDSAIYNAKVLNKAGAGITSQIIAGINWAVEQDADVISMSFGGMFTELDGPLASAVKEAINNGVVFVVAAGNCKTGCGGFYGVTTPGNVKEVITIGAVDDDNVVASFSSGDTFDGYIKPDVVAPGKDITSAWLNNGEKTLSGTSMSAPFAAGIAALLLEKEPGLTNELVKQRLESTSTDKGTTGKDTSYGSGIVDVQSLFAGTTVDLNQSYNSSTDVQVHPRLNLSDIANYNLSNFTILGEEEHRGRYQYNTQDGGVVIFGFSIGEKENATNLSAQMLLPSEVEPQDTVPVILEFLAGDRPVDPPYYMTFEVRKSNGAFAIFPQIYTLTSFFINLLYSADTTDIVTIDITFTAPSAYDTYTAYGYLWNDDPDPAIIDIDSGGKDFQVVPSASSFDECDSDGDCPADRWRGGTFCENGDVYQDYRDWYCVGPSTKYSFCNVDIFPRQKEECGTGSCSGGVCIPECHDDDNDGEGVENSCPFFSDCDDTNPLVHHGAEEICGNEIDENCFGGADEGCLGKPCTSNSQCQSNVCYSGTCIPPCPDSDEDGYGGIFNPVCTNPGIDCDDTNQFVNPGAAEWCTDGIDNNCNGLINENCPCTKKSNCATGMSCIFTGTAGSCQPATCENECPVAGVSTCSGTAIYTCTNSDGDACLENAYTANCGTGTICEDGKNTCQPKPNVELQLEETQLPLYAQAGDKITAKLNSASTQNAQLVYNTAVFALETTSCSGTFTFSGYRECIFTVKETAQPKAHWIGVKNGPSRKVTVVTKPNVLIITHKPMLYQRFESTSAVTTLLKQTYDYAYNKRGIVYDLADYNLPAHPFDGQPYTETYDDQDMKDNTFAIEAGVFIKDRCHGCTNTLILGDDFVVPHYRRDLDKSFFFGLSKETDEVYSDISYVGRTNLQFSEFEEMFYQKEQFNGKKVMLILPDEVTPMQRAQIDRLKDFIEDDNGPINGEIIDELEASDAPCNSHLAFTYYDGYTLIIIGTSQTNKALQCFPFVIENDLESVTIERNPWDGRAYAVVVNSDNADQIAVLNDLLETGEYKNLSSSGWLVASTAGNVAAGAAVGLVILGSGGTAAPVLLIAASGLSLAADSVDGAECLEFGGGECTEFMVGLALPFGIEKIGKHFIKGAIEIVGPRLRYFNEALGEDGFAAFFKRMGNKGMLNSGSGFDKLMKYIGENDRVGNTAVKDLSEYLARSSDEFTAFLTSIAKTDPIKAVRILQIAQTANFDKTALSILAKRGGMQTNLLVKSVDELGDSFVTIPDTVVDYSNGQLRGLFRGLSTKIPSDPSGAASAIENELKKHGQSGYDYFRQMGDGGFSDQATVSFTNDFKVAARYTTNDNNDLFEGAILVFDKRMAPLVDSQSSLKALKEQIPDAKVHLTPSGSLTDPTIPIHQLYGNTLANNEISHIGAVKIENIIGWYRTYREGNRIAISKFVPNPKYVGKTSEAAHLSDANNIRSLQASNNVENSVAPDFKLTHESISWDDLVIK